MLRKAEEARPLVRDIRRASPPIGGVVIALECVLALFYFLWVRSEAGMLEFATPWVLVALPLVLILGVRQLLRSRSPMLKFSYTDLARNVPQSLAELLRPAVQTLALLGLCFLIVAAARPQSVRAGAHDAAEGIDIVIALDVSGSMEAADFKPNNRLFVAKEVLQDFVSQRKNDRIGLIVFAGEAFTQVPLTLDYSVLINLLGDIRTGVIPDGTAIGDALGTAVNRLRDQPSKTKVVLLLTDGDSNAGALPPLEAASIAADQHVKVYTILIGKDGLVPFPQGRDLFGNTVYQNVKIPINPELLQEISKRTNALSFRAEDKESLIKGLHGALDHLEKSKFEDAASTRKEELFMRFLPIGLLLLALERLLRLTRFSEAFD